MRGNSDARFPTRLSFDLALGLPRQLVVDLDQSLPFAVCIEAGQGPSRVPAKLCSLSGFVDQSIDRLRNGTRIVRIEHQSYASSQYKSLRFGIVSGKNRQPRCQILENLVRQCVGKI